jgi:hypothetical protein
MADRELSPRTQEGRERRTFVGNATGSHEDETFVTFDEALASAVVKVVDAKHVTEATGPTWFEVTSIRVEIENQNIRTFAIGISGP